MFGVLFAVAAVFAELKFVLEVHVLIGEVIDTFTLRAFHLDAILSACHMLK